MGRIAAAVLCAAGLTACVDTAYTALDPDGAPPTDAGDASILDAQSSDTNVGDSGPGADSSAGTDASGGTDSGPGTDSGVIPAGDIYVDDDADPLTADGSLANPFPTITEGVGVCPVGGTVVILPGTYVENVTISSDCNLVGTDRDQVTLDANGSGRGLRISSATVNVSGITVTGASTSNTGGGVRIDMGATVTLTDCAVVDNEVTGNSHGAGIGIYEGSNVVIERCLIAGNEALGSGGDGAGITASGAGTVDIANTIIAQNLADGVGGGVRTSNGSIVAIVSSTVADNVASFESGISCGSGTPASVHASIVWGNATGAVDPDCGSTTASDIEGGGSGAALDADPLFVNSGALDYHLSPGSPCADFSPTITGARPDDYDGAPRDGAPDMGADELGAP